jgi:hypothetical protein
VREFGGSVRSARGGPESELETLLSAGEHALEAEGNLTAGRELYENAYRLAAATGDAETMATAVLGVGGTWLGAFRGVTDSARLEGRLRDVLALLDPAGPPAFRVRARLAGERDYRTASCAGVLPLLDEVAGQPDPRIRAEVLHIVRQCLPAPEHADRRAAVSARLVDESFRTGRRADLLTGLLWRTVDLLLVGDGQATRVLGELKTHLREHDHLATRFVVGAIDVMLAIRAGRFERAEELARSCAELGASAGDIDGRVWHLAQVATIRWHQGRLAELLPVLEELLDSPVLSPVDHSLLAGYAVAAAAAGETRGASSALARLSTPSLAALPRSSSWLVTLRGVVEAAHLLGDARAAEEAYVLLEPYADLPTMGGIGITCFGSVRYALGLAALTTGDLDRAVGQFEAAVRHNLALAHWPAVVASRRRLAEALAGRRSHADREAARTESARAHDEATALGIPHAVRDFPEAREAAGQRAVCVRRGKRWQVSLGGRSVLVDACVGMFHLAVLTSNPGTEIPAVELVAGVAALREATAQPTLPAQPLLDRAAVRAYRERLERLEGVIADAERSAEGVAGGVADIAAARAERDWILDELTRSLGLGGRVRHFAEAGERARVAAGKAIRRALARIEAADPLIGGHLRRGVHTGVRCAYWP